MHIIYTKSIVAVLFLYAVDVPEKLSYHFILSLYHLHCITLLHITFTTILMQ
jgi:hypothetical protein